MSTIYINDGKPVRVWSGLDAARLRAACEFADSSEFFPLSLVASLMDAGEPITFSAFSAAVVAYNTIQDRLVSNFVGVVLYNRNGQLWGGSHPALNFYFKGLKK